MARPRKTGSLARWAVRLSAFKLFPRHIRGVDDVVADALSRMLECSPPPSDSSISVNTVPLTDFPVAFENLKHHQIHDHSLTSIVEKLSSGEKVGNYLLKQVLLYCVSSFDKRPKLVLPGSLVPMIFRYSRESTYGANLGVFKTMNKIRPFSFRLVWTRTFMPVFGLVRFALSVNRP